MTVAAGIRDLDAERRTVGEEAELQAEVTSPHPPVAHGVRGEFGHEERGRLVRLRAAPPAPGVQLADRQTAGSAGARAVAESRTVKWRAAAAGSAASAWDAVEWAISAFMSLSVVARLYAEQRSRRYAASLSGGCPGLSGR